MVIAEGLKHPRIQESCLWLPDCIYPGPNAQYVGDGACVLPAIGDTPELVVEPAWQPEVTLHETPPGGWRFPGIPASNHYASAVSFMRQQHPEWSNDEALERLKEHNRTLNPDFYNNGLAHELRKFMVAKRNAGLA